MECFLVESGRFLEIISDCTEIYGRKNQLGESPEMILSQKASTRSDVYRNTVDQPFRPNAFETGVLARNERPEYAEAYREHTERMLAASGQ